MIIIPARTENAIIRNTTCPETAALVAADGGGELVELAGRGVEGVERGNGGGDGGRELVDGGGAETGEAPSSWFSTVMTSFCPASQWRPTPQMYHFFPGVVNTMTSFPVVSGSTSAGGTHLWKDVPLTLNTLCSPCLYLNTVHPPN